MEKLTNSNDPRTLSEGELALNRIVKDYYDIYIQTHDGKEKLTDFIREAIRANAIDYTEEEIAQFVLCNSAAPYYFFGDEVADEVENIGCHSGRGLITLLWQMSHAYADLREKLAAYESTGLSPDNVCALKDKSIKALTADIHQNAIDHGWWEGEERTLEELVALCHSELSEALEEYRNGHKPDETYFNEDKPNKPEGIPTELADCIIRILDMCGHYGIDIEKAILDKHECNISRPYKHGGKVI